MFNIDDTIVAISSSPGYGARGVIRISGPTSIKLAAQVFKADNLPDADFAKLSDRPRGSKPIRFFGKCLLGAGAVCSGEGLVFFSPRSYTCQDTVELHVPSSLPLLRMLLQKLVGAGARLAGPGEFTARAFFNGRLDLSQAEAVAAVIWAQSDAQLRAAQRLLDGALYRFCGEIQRELAEILALIEAQIDFSQDEIELISSDHFQRQLSGLIPRLSKLVDQSISWEQLDLLPRVVLAGRSNAGKSSLANALLGFDRSIVSAIAGTTRDYLTAPLRLKNNECLLIDTAGFGAVGEPLGKAAESLSLSQIAKSDVILYVVDICDVFGRLDEVRATLDGIGHDKAVVLANKIDLLSDASSPIESLSKQLSCPVIGVSAIRGDHLFDVKSLIDSKLMSDLTPSDQEIALTARQKQALLAAIENLNQACRVFTDRGADQTEIIAFYLREAIDHLGEISGHIVPDDILGMIFGRFCIGK